MEVYRNKTHYAKEKEIHLQTANKREKAGRLIKIMKN